MTKGERNVIFTRATYLRNQFDENEAYAGGEMERIALGNLELDRRRFEARIDGERVDLTSTQFELLYHLASMAERVVDGDKLIEAVWGEPSPEEGRKLRIQVSRLRKKVAASRPWQIETVKGRGYALMNAEAGIRLPAFVLASAPCIRPAQEFLSAGS